MDAPASAPLPESGPAIEIQPPSERAAPEVEGPSARPEVPAPAASGFSAEALAELEARLEMRLEAALIEAGDKLQQTRTDISRLDAACDVLASRLEVSERQAGDAATALTEARQALEARFNALQDRAQSVSQEVARIHELAERVEDTATRLDGHEQRLTSGFERLAAAEKAVDAQDKRHRTLEDDVGMALAALTERAEKLQQQISGFGPAFESLQRAVDEKTNQGRREAEDIRTQLSPLLEAHGQRHAADERMLSEIDRLRESLADSLADLSEHLRRAVRGI